MSMHVSHRENVWPIGLLCILATLALGSSAQTVPAPAIIVTLLGLYLVFGYPRLPKPRSFLAFVLAVPFALWYREQGDAVRMNEYVPVTLLFVVGLYMMALAAHHVMAIGKGGSRDYALACAVMGMGMAGTAQTNMFYLPLLMVFVPVLLWHIRTEILTGSDWHWRHAPWVKLGAAMVALGAITVGMHVFVVEKIPAINQWAVSQLVRHGGRSSVGFDRSTDLKTVLGVWGREGDPSEQEIAIHVFAADRPDPYLRGAVYDRYHDGVWRVIEEQQTLDPTGAKLGRNIFNTRSAESGEFVAMVYADGRYDDTFFLPIGVHQFTSFADRARYGRAYTARPNRDSSAGGYGYYKPASSMPAPTEQELQIPGEIDRNIRRLAHEVMRDDLPPAENIARLESYFAKHFEYQRGMERDTRKDPVLEFLEDQRKGHCEFFATAAALMLRSMDIPSRYVTGFVADEPGLGDVWIARRKDAHAWVEAYLGDELGWRIVEATPASAQPETAPISDTARFGEWIAMQWGRLVQLVASGGVMAVAASIWDMIVTLPQRVPIWAWLVLIALGVAWVFRNDLKRFIVGTDQRDLPARVIELQRQLATAEKMLARHGVRRPASMTVGRFIQRVRQAEHLPEPIRAEAEPLLREYHEQRFRPVEGPER